MDGLMQVVVVNHSTSVTVILGLRGDGALYRGQVTTDSGTGKASVVWTPVIDETRGGS
jgi:hypothetical protein